MKNIVRHYLLTTAYQRRGAGVLSQTPEPNRSKHPMQRRFFFNYELKFRLPHIFWLHSLTLDGTLICRLLTSKPAYTPKQGPRALYVSFGS